LPHVGKNLPAEAHGAEDLGSGRFVFGPLLRFKEDRTQSGKRGILPELCDGSTQPM